MQPVYARFASSPIGTNLAVRDAGITLSPLAAGTAGTARSDIALAAGTAGFEVAAWGDDDAQTAVIGVVTAAAALGVAPGRNSGGIGWDLAAGTVRHNNIVLVSGLPAVALGQIAGVRVLRATSRIEFYREGVRVHERALPLTGSLHFAASLTATDPGKLHLAVNAGQWIAVSAAGAAGWMQPAASAAGARVSDLPYLAAASDPTPHARYEGMLVEGVTIVDSLGFWPWAEQPKTGTGAEATVIDGDGRLDALAMADSVGMPVALRRTARNAGTAASSPVARFRLEGVTVVDDRRKRLLLADAHDDLDLPLSLGTFLPNTPALAWQPMPVVIGAVASVPALSASSDGTVRFLSDARVHVGDVMDRGDLMEPGTVALSPDGQQLLMTSPPVAPVVADCSSIGVSNGEPTPATLQQAVTEIMRRCRKTNWSAADLAAIDTASGYAGLGYYGSDAVTARTALHALLSSYGAWYYRDPDGVLRFARIVAPESVTPVDEYLASDMAADLIARVDAAPNLTRRVAYRLNAQALGSSDLVTDFEDVPQARRDQLTALWRGQVYAPGALPARYRHADSAEPFLSGLWRREDTQSEADRIIAMYASERRFFEATFRGTRRTAPRPGSVLTLKYPRYGLTTGKPVLVRAVTRTEGADDFRLTLWG